ncbi:MAG: AgmX/PglI C-terminal domain-containing protein [Bdellovibrionales bacterium]|nr:AgmX/PglI C-terminal domain-containing protein [Bdellovibrionales bacterium]
MKLNRICFGVLITCVITVSSYGMNFIYKYYAQNKKISLVKPEVVPEKVKNKRTIVSIIKNNLQEIEDCYNQSLEQGLEQEGALQIGWYLDGSGLPQEIEEMINELNDPDLYECSEAAIKHWQFPKNIVLKVHYTFHLRQKRQPSSKNFEDHSNNEY